MVWQCEYFFSIVCAVHVLIQPVQVSAFYSTTLQESRAIARKPHDAARFPTPYDSSVVIYFSLRKVKAVIAPEVICRLKAD